MGFLTTVTIRNDYLGRYEEDAAQLGLDILGGMSDAQLHHRATRNFNGIVVQPSFHADDHQVFLHKGNTLMNVTAYSNDLVDLYEKMPDVAEDYVKRLNQMARDSRECLKRLKEKKKGKV